MLTMLNNITVRDTPTIHTYIVVNSMIIGVLTGISIYNTFVNIIISIVMYININLLYTLYIKDDLEEEFEYINYNNSLNIRIKKIKEEQTPKKIEKDYYL